jgi:hypothetical protein
VTGRFELDPVGGEKLQAALESVVQAGRCAGDERTRSQQLADALVQLCDNALASGALPILRTVKPHVVLTVDVDDLADSAVGRGAAELGFGATISAARARWIACDGQVTRIVMGPDGLPLDVGRTQRVVPPHLRKAVERRDRHCVFAGCGAPTHWCDVHHLIEWVNGGETNLENSALLCERHSHVGPPRLPRRTTTRRPVAHLATRRHPDPHRPAAHRTTAGHRRLTRRTTPTTAGNRPTPTAGHRSAAGCVRVGNRRRGNSRQRPGAAAVGAARRRRGTVPRRSHQPQDARRRGEHRGDQQYDGEGDLRARAPLRVVVGLPDAPRAAEQETAQDHQQDREGHARNRSPTIGVTERPWSRGRR